MFEFTWERILQFASSPALLSTHDPAQFRRVDVYRSYTEKGCTIDLDFPSEWLLIPNAYPYNVSAGISHFVLFRRRDLALASPVEFLDGVFHDRDVAWYENPESIRSIKTVRHYHVFVKDRS